MSPATGLTLQEFHRPGDRRGVEFRNRPLPYRRLRLLERLDPQVSPLLRTKSRRKIY